MTLRDLNNNSYYTIKIPRRSWILAARGGWVGERPIDGIHEGQRFPRSVVKRRPRGRVGGKTRKKKGFIGGGGETCSACGMDRFCVIPRPPLSLFLFPIARRYGFPRDVAHTRYNADTRMHARTRRYAQRRGGTSSPSGSHVFPTASRSYNGAVASRRPGRRKRTSKRANEWTNERTSDAANCLLLPLPSSSSCTKRDGLLLQRVFQRALFSRKRPGNVSVVTSTSRKTPTLFSSIIDPFRLALVCSAIVTVFLSKVLLSVKKYSIPIKRRCMYILLRIFDKFENLTFLLHMGEIIESFHSFLFFY